MVKPLMQNPQEMAKDLEPVMKVKANVAKKRKISGKPAYTQGAPDGKQTKFASPEYAQGLLQEA